MPQDEAHDGEMRDKDEEKAEVTMNSDNDNERAIGKKEPARHLKKEEAVAEETAATSKGEQKDKDQINAYDVAGEDSARVAKDSETKKVATEGSALEWSSKHEESTPSSNLEKSLRRRDADPKTSYCQLLQEENTSDTMCNLISCNTTNRPHQEVI